MRKLTVKISDEVYQAARLYSARNKTSIANVFAEFLGILHNAHRIAPLFLREESPEFYREMLKDYPSYLDRLPYVMWQSIWPSANLSAPPNHHRKPKGQKHDHPEAE
jgi:hypothetical protein